MTNYTRAIRSYVDAELASARAARTRGDCVAEFRYLERAHVLGQASTSQHVRTHWHMLAWAIRQRVPKEFIGQIVRIVGAATLTAVGLVPPGNTGGANVSPVQPFPTPADLAEIIEQARRQGRGLSSSTITNDGKISSRPEHSTTVFGKVLFHALLSVLIVVLAMIATNLISTRTERSSLQPPGKMVDVLGTKMYVYTTGSGSTNVVLLSGLGTLSPVIDFQPLIRELKSKARVTVVEYPGYGWSQDSDRERSTATSVEEIRLALRKAGIAPPYVLVVHSISGLQALYYTNRYPDEIVGVVGLDSSLPAQLLYFSPKQERFNASELLRVLGVVRMVLLLKPEMSGAQTGELTPQEAADFGTISKWNFGTHAIWNEGNSLRKNFDSTAGMTFPKGIPVTLVLASESIAKVAPEIPGQVWLTEHQKLVAGNPRGKVIEMHGSHYIHHGNTRRVADLILEVIGRSGVEEIQMSSFGQAAR